jgi:hypothetical protein
LNIDRRDTSAFGTRAVLSSQQLIALSSPEPGPHYYRDIVESSQSAIPDRAEAISNPLIVQSSCAPIR